MDVKLRPSTHFEDRVDIPGNEAASSILGEVFQSRESVDAFLEWLSGPFVPDEEGEMSNDINAGGITRRGNNVTFTLYAFDIENTMSVDDLVTLTKAWLNGVENVQISGRTDQGPSLT